MSDDVPTQTPVHRGSHPGNPTRYDEVRADGHDAEPRGTFALVWAFLAMCVFMFSWAYWLLLLRA